MKNRNMNLWLLAAFLVAAAHTVSAESTWLETLLAGYERIESVTCDVRRDMSNEDGSIRWLSRVHYQRLDRLHVENFSPLPRGIIADGETMYQHNDGHPRGFRRSIAELDQTMVYNLRRVPGTVMEHLFRLRDAEEIVLPATDEFPIRHGYPAGDVFVVLEADEKGRLTRVLFYADQDQTERTGDITCSHFEEVLEGVWIPMRHRIHVTAGGMTSRETVRFSNYEVNIEIPARLFDPSLFWDDVRWVDTFDRL